MSLREKTSASEEHHRSTAASPRSIRATTGLLLLAALLSPAGAEGAQAIYSDDRNPNVFPPLYEFGAWGEEAGRLNGPASVAVGAGDRIFVADSSNHRIQIFSLQGRPLGGWGRMGSAPSEFLFPRGVALGAGGEVFVADTGNDRIQVFDGQGKFLREWGRRGSDPGSFLSPVGVTVFKDAVCVAEREAHRLQVFDRTGGLRKAFGGFGEAPGRFREPLGVAFDDEGRIYVADSGNHRIQKLDAEGAPLGEWGKWGPHPGFLSSPSAVASFGGRLYVADSGNHRVQVFDRTGSLLSQWGRHPATGHEGKGRLHFPAGLAVNPTGGFTVVVEPLEHRLQVFANGSARKIKRVTDFPWWDDLHQRMHGMVPASPAPYTGPSIWDTNPPQFAPILEQDAHALLGYDLGRRPAFFVGRSAGFGRRLGEFNGPGRLALDRSNRQVWVTDRHNRRIQILEFSRDDRSISGFAAAPRTIASFEPGSLVPSSIKGFDAALSSVDAVALHPKGEVYVVDGVHGLLLVFDRQYRFVNALRPPTPPSGRPPRPVDVAFSPDGRRIYVVDGANFRIAVLEESGQEAGGWGCHGTVSDDGFGEPAGIAIDAEGFVYVTDRSQHRVKKYDSRGKYVLQWGVLGMGPGQFQFPEAIHFHPGGFIVVDDLGNHRGLTFTKEGKPVEMFSKGGSAGPVQR